MPVVAGVDFGHHVANVPLPIGIQAAIDTEKAEFALIEAAVQ